MSYKFIIFFKRSASFLSSHTESLLVSDMIFFLVYILSITVEKIFKNWLHKVFKNSVDDEMPYLEMKK